MALATDPLTVSRARVEQAYREIGQRLWRALYAYAGNRDVADEGVSEAFAQALRRGPEIRDPRRWVWSAAFRIAAGELKLRGRDRRPVPDVTEEVHDRLPLIEAMGQLSPQQRAVLVLYYYEGYPTREIAEILGTSHATVRVQMMRGRRRLREVWENDDEPKEEG